MLGDDDLDKLANNVDNLSTIFNGIHPTNLCVIINKQNVVKVT